MRLIATALALLAVVLFPPLAKAQTGCTPQSQAANLNAFRDGQGPGGITPLVMRNLVCSTVNNSGGDASNTDVTATGGTTARTLAARAADVVNATDYGMVCDGSTDDSGALQAAVTATGSGKTLIIPLAGTCVLGSAISITQNNVVIRGAGWGTILQRSATLTGVMLNVTGVGVRMADIAVDGNGTTNTTNSNADLKLGGANDLADHIKVVNARARGVALSGAGGRITGSTISGIGSSTLQTYGIWAINGVQVFIDHNYVTGSGIDAIGADGNGTVIDSNYVSNNHCYTGIGGGQIVTYNTASNLGIVVSNNVIDPGCGPVAYGIEVDSVGPVVEGNVVRNQQFYGIILDAHTSEVTLEGNSVRNSGSSTPGPAVQVSANVSGVNIRGNTLIDDRGVGATQTYALVVATGSSNNYAVTGNIMTGNVSGAVLDNGTGLNKQFANNIGIDDVQPSIASAATVSFPINPIFALTGSTGVTAISGDAWTGRQVTVIPSGAVTFSAGATIANTITSSAGVPVIATYNGSSWNLK